MKITKQSLRRAYKRAKYFLLFLFVGIIVFDVVLVFWASKGFPTISKVMLNLMPQFLVVIWAFGVMTGNVFFPRRSGRLWGGRTWRLVVLSLIGGAFLYLGNELAAYTDGKSCGDVETSDGFYWSFLQVDCIDLDPTQNMRYIDCANPNLDECQTKLNLTTDAKLMFLLFGMLCGFVIWPQVPDGESQAA